MKIKYIVTALQSDRVSEHTISTIKKNSVKGEEHTVCTHKKDQEPKELNATIQDNIEAWRKDKYTHVCIIPNNSGVADNYRKIVKGYVKDKDVVYLTIVQHVEPEDKEKDEGVFRGFLNTCVWKPYMYNKTGELTLELAKKQIDTTLYGALIPLSVIGEHKLKEKIKYYSFFEYLSRLANKDVVIKGIPKVVFHHVSDLRLKQVPQDEKIKYFKACQHEYEHDEDRDISDNYNVSQEVIKAKPTSVNG